MCNCKNLVMSSLQNVKFKKNLKKMQFNGENIFQKANKWLPPV